MATYVSDCSPRAAHAVRSDQKLRPGLIMFTLVGGWELDDQKDFFLNFAPDKGNIFYRQIIKVNQADLISKEPNQYHLSVNHTKLISKEPNINHVQVGKEPAVVVGMKKYF